MNVSKWTPALRLTGGIGILLSVTLLCGCTPAEIQEVTSAVSALEANKALAEQFVKDVKREYEPADPQYQKIMAQYEESRDTYNAYIGQVENAAANGRKLTSVRQSEDDVQQSAVSFISAATRSLDPRFNGSRSLEHAIRIPRNLPSSVAKLSNSARKLLSDRFGGEMRWKSWSQLE